MNVSNTALNIAHSHPVSTGVALTTTGTGIADFLNLIPDDIGKLASLVGMCLSFVLIYSTLISARKTMKETQLLEQQIKNNENKTTPNC